MNKSVLIQGFSRLGLPVIKRDRKFPLRRDYFEYIDTAEKAYILGFYFADGCNQEKKHRVQLSISETDIELLKTFSKIFLDGNIQITTYQPKHKNYKNIVSLNIIDRDFSFYLAQHGCISNKTFVLKFPKLDDNLVSHFIRGYFDGDGCLSSSMRKRVKTDYEYFTLNMVGTKEFLEGICLFFRDNKINCSWSKRHKARKNNNYTISISGNQQIKRACDIIYRDADIFLDRKYLKYTTLCDLIATK